MTGAAYRFSGYAALFDRPDRAGDVFRRGAFAGAAEAPLLLQHRGRPVGRVLIAEDARGLRVTGEADGPVAEGQGLSVGYRPVTVRRGAWRELLAVELVEVSLVAQPMQPLARVSAAESLGQRQLAEDSSAPSSGVAEPSAAESLGQRKLAEDSSAPGSGAAKPSPSDGVDARPVEGVAPD